MINRIQFLFGSVHWIKHKQKMAIEQCEKAKDKLDRLSKTHNPFANSQLNYKCNFFEAQWQDQQTFQKTHTNLETEERERLAEYLDHQATLKTLR
jgi:hypothetical protein